MPITNTPKLTEENKKWLSSHSAKFTAREISDWMQVKEYTIESYCQAESLKLLPSVDDYKPPESIYFDVDEYTKEIVTI